MEKYKIQMRKRNMKLFPIYKRLAWDYMFFYTINFLFLTQVKNISAADVVLIDAFYSLFGILMQIPAVFIVEFLGRKNSLILGNVLNGIYILIVIFSQGLSNLIFAEMASSIAFAIKGIAEPSLLNESIPPSKYKGKIYTKINSKGDAGYYILNAVTTIIAGFLFEINGYIPLILSFITIVIVIILSCMFIEPIKSKKRRNLNKIDEQINDIKESFKFILKSERIKSLILCGSIITGLVYILSTYEVSILEDLQIQAKYIGIIFAILGIVTGISSRYQQKFHEKFKNRSLGVIGFTSSLVTLIVGILAIFAKNIKYIVLIILIFYFIRRIVLGVYYSLVEKYLRNFANEKIDTKIFTANNFIKSILATVFQLGAAFILDKMETAYCMIFVGIIFSVLMILVEKYMKSRVGLKPDQYSKEEIKYDDINIVNKV